MSVYRAARSYPPYEHNTVAVYKHFVIVKGYQEHCVKGTMRAIVAWFVATHPGMLDGEPVPREDHKPDTSRYHEDGVRLSSSPSRTIIYVNLMRGSELVESSFVAFIGQRAAEYAPAMVCIQQNEAHKSNETMYGLLVITPGCEDKKNL